MAKYGLMVVAAALVLALTLQEATALKCWRCSSDASNAAFCGDPFDSTIVTEQQRRWSYVDCSHPPSQLQNPYSQQIQPAQRSVCKKIKQIIHDKTVVSRSCFWEDVNAPRDSCQTAGTPSYIRTEFCETCTTDGCNGAAQYGPAAIVVVATALVAKLLA